MLLPLVCPPALTPDSLRPALAPQFDDPVLQAADVEKKEGTVRRVCEPILSKPPPAPKKEEPAAAAPAEEGEEMDTDAEVGPQPPGEDEQEQQQETPMEA